MAKSKLYLIRGAAGSGKSTLAKTIGCPVFEADMFFETSEGYKYDPNKIKDAHWWCQLQVQACLHRGESVAVSNTFTKLWELAPYFALGQVFDIEIVVFHCTNQYENTHGVPEHVVQRMRDNYEPLPQENLFPPVN